MLRKGLLTILILSLATTLAVSGALAKTKITYWAIWGGYEQKAVEQVVKWFNESQNKIEVEYVRVPDYRQKLLASIAAGDVPDAAFLWSNDVSDFVYRDGLVPLDEFMAVSDVSRDKFANALIDLCTINGKVYALPTLPWTYALYYNKGILRETGLDPERPPRTIQELDAMVKKLVIVGADGRLERLGMTPWTIWERWQWSGLFGGRLYDGKNHKVTLTDPKNVEAFGWLSSYSKKWGVTQLQTFQGGFGSFFSETYPFWARKTVFDIQGTWMGKYIKNNAPDLEWGIAPPPVQPPVKYGTAFAYADVNIIPKGSKHPREAFEFLKFWYKPEINRFLSKQFYTYSSLVSVNRDPEFIRTHDNPKVQLNSDLAMADTAFGMPKVPVYGYMMKELDAAIDEIVYLKKEPEAALKDAEKKVERELQKVMRQRR